MSLYNFLYMLSFLTFATIVNRIFLYLRPGKEMNQVWIKIRTWWVISLTLCTCMFLGTISLSIFMAVILFFSMKEFLDLTSISTLKKDQILIWQFSAIVLYTITQALNKNLWIYLVFIICWIAFSYLAFANANSQMIKRIFGMIYLVLGLSAIPSLGTSTPAVFFILFLTSLNDIFQYLTGRIFKGPKLAPRISPNKTLSGLIGGMVGSGLISISLAHNFISIHYFSAFLLGVFLSILGTIGDLTISLYKRRAQVKDTGSLLPGHGGILDRIDSLCMTAPAFTFIIYLKG